MRKIIILTTFCVCSLLVSSQTLPQIKIEATDSFYLKTNRWVYVYRDGLFIDSVWYDNLVGFASRLDAIRENAIKEKLWRQMQPIRK